MKENVHVDTHNAQEGFLKRDTQNKSPPKRKKLRNLLIYLFIYSCLETMKTTDFKRN